MSIKDKVSFYIFQFDDDTKLLREGSWKNFWSLKAILRGFELVFGLGVNFCKSNIYNINMKNHFSQVASNFLSYNNEGMPFKFLGIPIRSNPSRIYIWNPILDKLKVKLTSCKGRFLFQEGRVTLINSTLNSFPIFL